jgi:DGQHR domain-containing protein
MNQVKVPALVVHQWLKSWDHINYDPDLHQRKPEEFFYMFSMKASLLRKLSGIYRRNTSEGLPRENDLGVQRHHDIKRSEEISRYVRNGYPWSTLSSAKQNNTENDGLKKPGWLPTAVVVNILIPGDKRSGEAIKHENVIEIDQAGDSYATLTCPKADLDNDEVHPIEIIDGQHRLFAFDGDDSLGDDYELPVVAFHGLDIAWQAYLFWTINIKPKKINASLAFDLYPLLREESWLYAGEALPVYRESRAQDLTSALWSYEKSPWFRRINMLGGPRKENGPVTQAAFIRSLTSSLIKPWDSNRGHGGLFGGSTNPQDAGLSWSRVQQAAFLVTIWQILYLEVGKFKEGWAAALRGDAVNRDEESSNEPDPAFVDSSSLLASDQGVRGFQSVINDICRVNYKELKLQNWNLETDDDELGNVAITAAVASLKKQPVYSAIEALCGELVSFDWRSSSANNLPEEEREKKLVFRGSGGYKELRDQLLRHLQSCQNVNVKKLADKVNGTEVSQ